MAGSTVSNAVLDAALAKAGTSVQMTVCNAVPTTYTEATATFKLATVVMTAGTDFPISNGTGSGRKLDVAAKSGINIDATDTATHVALVDGTVLLYVALCTSQPLTQNNTLNVPSWAIEFAAPV